MAETIWMDAQALLDLSPEGPDALAVVLRTVIVYAVTLALVRLGSRRLLAKPSACDVIVAIMAGSILSRAINGSAPFVPTLVGGAVLKGMPIELVRDGKVVNDGLRRAHVTAEDLAEALRLRINDDDPANVEVAYMERNRFTA